PTAVVKNIATEARLNALAYYAGEGVVTLVGATSGAKATPEFVPDLEDALLLPLGTHAPYFLLRWMFQTDRTLDLNPQSEVTALLTTYVPVAGLTIDELNAVDCMPLEDRLQGQLQQHPYDPLLPDNEQFVPSFGPGLYSQWADALGAFPLFWGWKDVGKVASTPTNLNLFKLPACNPFYNVHVGVKTAGRGAQRHYTHGFRTFEIPAPQIVGVTNADAAHLRVEGWYFVDVDPSMVAVPTYDPATFDGTMGGCWVFLRQQSTQDEFAATTVTFETGTAAGRTVLGLPGLDQTSTGHVLIVGVPPLPGSGTYDTLVRNYRPYVMKAGGPTLYHMDEAVSYGTFVLPDGFGFAPFGGAPFGGA
ncbi:MAG: hypothetical protein ACOYOB_20600, partial [Myxococcota bacterium]